jgi:hypothetical protein
MVNMNTNSLIVLAETLAAHQGVSHWAISQRIYGRGDVFSRLMDGHNCFHSTIERAERWFAANWPEDLAWPEGVMRPDRQIAPEKVA